jgi:hypothetical protein
MKFLNALGSCSIFVAAAMVLCTGAARAEGRGGRTVRGQINSQEVTTGCTSPVGLCLAGTLTGGLTGDFSYTAASVTVTGDVAAFSGTTTLTTEHGELTELDQTTANEETGAFTDVITILSGTGEWKGCSGTVHASGTFDFATGVGTSDYEGQVYCPCDDDDGD